METLLFILIAYLLGSIPTGLWIGKRFYNTNLREHGSGNMGTTNTFRILGKKAGTITLTVDMLKGTLAVLLPIWFGGVAVSPLVVGFFAVLGHTFPVFAQFKGGKAVATSAGVLLGFAPNFLFFLAVVFAVTLFLFGMISLSSVTVSVVGILGVLLFPAIGFILPEYDLIFTILIILIASVIIIRHKENIERILQGKENLVPFGLNLSKQNPKK
ncbi:glycerol-3-phosphate 1-O-acyltransferase PlsY [Streptococcus sp. X16XC17]|uniref:glycerol-3-phosphate 1-O-acyltransferase PlsY n=1 Tax=unclassified Streptococcus TaxID=2608887 RepID=UPI00066FF5C6|nr:MULTISPECIES: glycerol-3-phosphate 1-O-acyltransferase PlsY [unclassified Streptococcus]TCD46280.1 glycerol-3-phosphate 1-O-acyltransferase PlsY [Streptococcus sp. X16XC17]